MALCSHAQNYSTDVVLISDNGDFVTLEASAVSEKKKDAETLASKSALHTLLTSGVEGLKNGTPMVTDLRGDYSYRLFNENRYINFFVDKPVNLGSMKIAKNQKATVRVTLNLKALKADLERNKLALSPTWSDPKKVKATASLNPQIVIVPYVDATTGYSFDAMRRQYEGDEVKRYAIDKVAEAFSRQGYKTYDFVSILQDTQLDDILRQGSQTDDATMIVQQLPGDIVVTTEVKVNTQGGVSELTLNLRALEKQTSGRLATNSFSSGRYQTTNGAALAGYAVDKIQGSFFEQLNNAFDDMVKKGREVNIDLNLSAGVSDWDFEQDTPITGRYFKDTLEEWLSENSVGQVYNMSRSTDKYVRITLNVPLWDMERNRPYTLSNFQSAVRNFFRQHLGNYYKANITSMGQKLVITIE